MALTTTDSLSGRKPKPERCSKCRERSPQLIVSEMNERLCPKCAPAKLVLGYPVTE